MKTLSELLTELRQLDELLGIYTNPNAYEPKGGHYETPKEREARLKFERSPRGQALIAAAQRRDAKALKKFERMKKLGIKPTTRKPFPWRVDCAGWWHAEKPWFTFYHPYGEEYHITQVIKSPQRFGITDSEIDQAINEFIRKRDKSDKEYYLNTYNRRFDDDVKTVDVKIIRALMKDGVIDLCPPLAKRVYDKGWLKVYGGDCSLEGTSIPAMKAAVREIITVKGKGIDVDILQITPGGHTNYSIYGMSDAERFLLK